MKRISKKDIKRPRSVEDFRQNLLKYFKSSYSMTEETILAISNKKYISNKSIQTDMDLISYVDVDKLHSMSDLAKIWYQHMSKTDTIGHPPSCFIELSPLIIPLNTEGLFEIEKGLGKIKGETNYFFGKTVFDGKKSWNIAKWYSDETNHIIFENEKGNGDNGQEFYELGRKHYGANYEDSRPFFMDFLLRPFYQHILGKYIGDYI